MGFQWPFVRRSRLEEAERTVRYYEAKIDEAERILQVVDPEHRADPEKCYGCGCQMLPIDVQAHYRVNYPSQCWRPVPQALPAGGEDVVW